MKIFISWHGNTSGRLADVLREQIATVMPDVELFLSSRDLSGGTRWQRGVHDALRDADFGIICLTPSNLHCQWILFESGALSKLDTSRVCPFLYHLSRPPPGPLSQFQGYTCDESGSLLLIKTINSLRDANMQLNEKILEGCFKGAIWPSLERTIRELENEQEESEIEQIMSNLDLQRLDISLTRAKGQLELVKSRLDNGPSEKLFKYLDDYRETAQDCIAVDIEPIVGKKDLLLKVAKGIESSNSLRGIASLRRMLELLFNNMERYRGAHQETFFGIDELLRAHAPTDAFNDGQVPAKLDVLINNLAATHELLSTQLKPVSLTILAHVEFSRRVSGT